MRRLIALVCSVSILSLTACSHTVSIDSDPPGAKIKVDGQTMGTGPVMFTETSGWEKSYEIVAEKDGFKETRRYIKQTEWNQGALVGGIVGVIVCFPLGGIPIFFAKQLPDRVIVSLEEGGSGSSDSGSGSGGGDSVDDYGY